MLNDEQARRWQADYHELMHMGAPASTEEKVLRLIHNKAYEVASAIAEGASVLDVGRNIGYGTRLLSGVAREAIGIDVSQKALREAKARHGGGLAAFVLAEGKALPFPCGRFDLVVAFQLLEHLFSDEEFFVELRRVLGPAAVLLFSTPNKVVRLDEGMAPWNPMHTREFGASELGLLLGAHFPFVRLLGLTGHQGIRSVELSRLAEARRKARRLAKRTWRSAYAVADSVLPGSARRRLRTLLRRAVLHGRKEGQQGESFSRRDLYYSDRDLDSALDLLAVCRPIGEEPSEILSTIQARESDTS